MKTKFSIQVFLHLLLALVFAACERGDAPPLLNPDKGMQAARPVEGSNGPDLCDCDFNCRSFGVAPSIEPSGAYAFAIGLKQLSVCDEALLASPKCYFKWDRFDISFVFDPTDTSRFDLSDIEEVMAVPIPSPDKPNPDGLGNQVFENLEGNKLSVYGESILYFKWKPGVAHPAPKLSNISTGGVCIIGIITDPNPPGPNILGRPVPPILLRRFRP